MEGNGFMGTKIHSLPLISVIVPVYNVAEYLPRCIESIICQTYSNLEILLVNDGSDDTSGTICEKYYQKDERVRVIHQENLGVSSARNAGLDTAKGEWVGFVDPDDWIEPEMLEILYRTAIENNTAIAICGYVKHCPGGWLDNRTCADIPSAIPEKELLRYVLSGRHFEGFVWNKLFSRVFLDKNNIRFDSKFSTCQDVVFVVSAAVHGASASYVPNALYHYCLRKGSSTQSISGKRLTELDAWARIIKLASPVSIEWAELSKARYAGAVVGLLRDAVAYNEKTHIPRLKKEARRYAGQFFRSKELDFRMKLRGMAIIFFPIISFRIWKAVKKFFRITWWYKELRSERV